MSNQPEKFPPVPETEGRMGWMMGSEAIWGSLPKLLACRAYTLNGPKGVFVITTGDPPTRQVMPGLMDFLDLSSSEAIDADFASITALQEQLEHRAVQGGILLANLRLLGEGMGLDDTALQLMHLRIVDRLSKPFSMVMTPLLLGCIDPIFFMHLDSILGLESGDAERLLAKDGALARSGLLVHKYGVGAPLEARLRLPPGLMGSLLKPLPSRADAIRRLVPLARPGHLALDDYPHLAREIRLVIAHVDRALSDSRLGVNVLIHGDPGTGKTQLVSAVAKNLEAALFVIGGMDPDTCVASKPIERLDRYRMAQGLVRSAGTSLLLVDEAEDLFPSPSRLKDDAPSKAVMTETLETNLVPTFWLTNRPELIDEPLLRRFDIVLHITPPARQRKAQLLTERIPSLASEPQWASQAVAHARMSPAVIARIGGVVAGMEQNLAASKDAFDVLRDQYLKALGYGAGMATGVLGQELKYGLMWLNPDTALGPVVEQMQKHPHGRLLFHGPPGTGKTALAHHLAEQLGRGLLVKRGSDLMSMWVGETEKNLRRMFEEAQRDGDVLLLDEADSFLAERNANQPRWQTAQTNELLTQMEAFDGLFICTTNLLEHLDAASFRRFDLKIGFGPLRSEQRLGIIRKACEDRRLDWDTTIEASVRLRQSDLVGLTPGDMATALRKLQLAYDQPQTHDLIEALVAECRFKSVHHPKMGFV